MKKCKSCDRAFEPEQKRQVRCGACQVDFDAWLRGDSPVTYQPRQDGVWRDVARHER
jgi:hypothetical protein